jgi:hypothetical protein
VRPVIVSDRWEYTGLRAAKEMIKYEFVPRDVLSTISDFTSMGVFCHLKLKYGEGDRAVAH